MDRGFSIRRDLFFIYFLFFGLRWQGWSKLSLVHRSQNTSGILQSRRIAPHREFLADLTPLFYLQFHICSSADEKCVFANNYFTLTKVNRLDWGEMNRRFQCTGKNNSQNSLHEL